MSEPAGLIAEMRRFNRFYTRTIGVLEETLTASPFTLTEARVLFELGHRARPAASDMPGERGFLADAFHLNVGPAASEIARELRLDPAYLTRILRKFAAAGLTEVRADTADRRRRILSLTAKGEAALADLQAAADRDVARLIAPIAPQARRRLAGAMQAIEATLASGSVAPEESAPSIVLRPHRIGDIGWVIERQSRLYAEEYGWNGEYEALVAEIGAAFIRNFRPGKEFCWIAEQGRRAPPAPSFSCARSDEDGQLRLLHVEREARGFGIGRLLVVAMRRDRQAGRLSQAGAVDQRRAGRRAASLRARRLHAGRQEHHHSFGKDLVGQTWELGL